MLIPRRQSVVPFAMKRVAHNGKSGKFLVGDFDSLRVGVFIEASLDAQSLSGGGAADQVNDDLPADQRAPSPVGGNVAEHAVLDLVPLAGAGREMTDLDRQPQLVGEFLQLSSPQAHPVAVAAPAVGGDQQPARADRPPRPFRATSAECSRPQTRRCRDRCRYSPGRC
jgi:hypothetical protein